MKALAAVAEKPGKMRIREFEIPKIGSDDGLLRIEMCGVCGTDIKLFHGLIHGHPAWPAIIGHEIVGRIEKVGSSASKLWGVKEGDHVIVEPQSGCGQCHRCLNGSYRFCKDAILYGFNRSCEVPPHLWGGYAQFMYLHPKANVYKISDDLPATLGMLIGAVIADEVRWVRTRGGVTLGDTVVIEGAGSQGLVAAAIAKEAGASLIIITGLSRDEPRIELAKELGANYFINVEKENPVAKVEEISGGRMADVVIDVSGSAEVPAISIDLVRPQGTIVDPSNTGFKQSPIITDKITLKEISYLGVFTCDAISMAQGIALAESRKYPFEKLVTHAYTLEEAAKAIAAAKGDVPGEYPIRATIVPW